MVNIYYKSVTGWALYYTGLKFKTLNFANHLPVQRRHTSSKTIKTNVVGNNYYTVDCQKDSLRLSLKENKLLLYTTIIYNFTLVYSSREFTACSS